MFAYREKLSDHFRKLINKLYILFRSHIYHLLKLFGTALSVSDWGDGSYTVWESDGSWTSYEADGSFTDYDPYGNIVGGGMSY